MAPISSYCCHLAKLLLYRFSFSYYHYQKDERTNPGNLLTRGCCSYPSPYKSASANFLTLSPALFNGMLGTMPRGTALQVGRSRVRLPMVSLEFFIDIILPAALWPWGRLSPYRNDYQEYFVAVKAAGA